MSSDDTRSRYRKSNCRKFHCGKVHCRKFGQPGVRAERALIAALAMAASLSLAVGLASPVAAQNNVFVNQQLLNSLGTGAVPYGQGFPPYGLPGQGFVGVPGGLLFPPQQQPRSTLTTPQAFGQPTQPGFAQQGFGSPFAQQGMPFYSGVQVYSATPRPPVTAFAQNQMQMGQAQAGTLPPGIVPPGTVPGAMAGAPRQIGQAPAPVPRPVAPRAQTRSEPPSQAFQPTDVARSGGTTAPRATAPQAAPEPAAQAATPPAPPPRTNRTAPPLLPSQALAEREAERAASNGGAATVPAPSSATPETTAPAPTVAQTPAVEDMGNVEDMGTDRNARTSDVSEAAPTTPAPASSTTASARTTPEPAATAAELQPIPPAPQPPPAIEPTAPSSETAGTGPASGTTQQAEARGTAASNPEPAASATAQAGAEAAGETAAAAGQETAAQSETTAQSETIPAAEPQPAQEQRAALPPEPEPEAETALAPDLLARIVFTEGRDEVATDGSAALNALAESLRADESQRIQLLAYAAGDSNQVNQARRLSLSRALAVRQFLIGQGVRSTRMDVRALGNNIPDGPPNRVDVVPAPR